MQYHKIVNYEKLDPVKKNALEKFSSSIEFPERLGIKIVPETIGEPAIAIDFGEKDFFLAFNVEGLGTKNLIADAMAMDARGKGAKYFESIGQDSIAMSTNDLLAIGGDAFCYGDIISSGSSDWFEEEKTKYLLEGYRKAAEEIGMAIPCGEIPTLNGIVAENTLDLAGAGIGIIQPKQKLLTGKSIHEGDTIFGLESSGVHSNGISLIRKTAEKLKQGYFTELESGKLLGEELLKPTTLYTRPLIEVLQKTEIHYFAPITGHGWKKIMRAKQEYSYEIESVPEKTELFSFLQKQTGINNEEAYYTWNMGIGYAVIAPQNSFEQLNDSCAKKGIKVFELGRVKKGKKQVKIKPLNVVYKR